MGQSYSLKTSASGNLLSLFRDAITTVVRDDGRDMTARQLSVLLAVYLDVDPKTVRGLSAAFLISRSAITRAVDRLEMIGLVQREEDPADRRSILIGRTAAGRQYVASLGRALVRGQAADPV